VRVGTELGRRDTGTDTKAEVIAVRVAGLALEVHQDRDSTL